MKGFCLLVYLVVLSIFDWRRKRVPTILLAGGVAAAVLYQIYICGQTSETMAADMIRICADAIPGVFLLLVAWLTRKIGWADGTVMLIVGLVQGGQRCVALLCISVFWAAIVSVVLLVMHRADRYSSLPYLPFLTVTYLAGLFA